MHSNAFLASLIALGGLLLTVFWMVVGWRAMRAHERLARAAEELAGNRRV
jgi:uncharacterized membrane protein